MKTQSKIIIKSFILLIVGAVVLLAFVAWLFEKPEYESAIYSTSGDYSFDPETVFKSLSQNDENTFKRIDSDDDFADITQNTYSVNWSQEDFLYVMRSFYRFLWREEPEVGWNLTNVQFRANCEDADDSFHFGSYDFFKLAFTPEGRIRKTRTIVIKPLEGTIWWLEANLSPVVENWKTIDLGNLKISVTDAISIAEANGGREIRLNEENDCDKTITGYYDEWRIAYYSPASDIPILKLYINNKTGDIEKNHKY